MRYWVKSTTKNYGVFSCAKSAADVIDKHWPSAFIIQAKSETGADKKARRVKANKTRSRLIECKCCGVLVDVF